MITPATSVALLFLTFCMRLGSAGAACLQVGVAAVVASAASSDCCESEAAGAPNHTRSPVAAPGGGTSGCTTSCAALLAHSTMPWLFTPRMLRGFRLQMTTTLRPCEMHTRTREPHRDAGPVWQQHKKPVPSSPNQTMFSCKEPHLHLLQRHKLHQAAHNGAWLWLADINLLHIQAVRIRVLLAAHDAAHTDVTSAHVWWWRRRSGCSSRRSCKARIACGCARVVEMAPAPHCSSISSRHMKHYNLLAQSARLLLAKGIAKPRTRWGLRHAAARHNEAHAHLLPCSDLAT